MEDDDYSNTVFPSGSFASLIGQQATLLSAEHHASVLAAQQQMNAGVQAQLSPANIYSMLGHASEMRQPVPTPADTATLSARAREMFLKRMGGIRAEMKLGTDDCIHCHIYGETVHVFYCLNGKSGTVNERIDLFPSDTLIIQFRLLLS
jgi:hypothetical protein